MVVVNALTMPELAVHTSQNRRTADRRMTAGIGRLPSAAEGELTKGKPGIARPTLS
jgi:hypothetical protein